MNKQSVLRIPTTLLVAVVLIAIVTGTFLAITQRATANEPNDTTAVSASVGSGITYQGELNKDDAPHTGNCDMKFQLYDAPSGGIATSFEVAQTVAVSDGIFTVNLDFGGNEFTGGARYLNIAVECAGDTGFTDMGSRVPITAVPYALSLRPGAVISSEVSHPLSVMTSSEIHNTSGLYGYSSAVSSFGPTYGVWGEINDSASRGAGVLGQAGPTQFVPGLHSGVLGLSDNGYGVAGVSEQASGVYGTTSSNIAAGVIGTADNGSSSGVLGNNYSTTGYGVRGYARANSGINYGVYGATNSPDGYGVYSEGDAHIDGDLTWKPVTGYVTLPAAAFRPWNQTLSFTNNGVSLQPSDGTASAYLGEVNLPHNAVVTKLTYNWSDNTAAADASASLYRVDLVGGESLMAQVFTSGSSNVPTASSTSSINDATIDNSTYGYYVWLNFPAPSNGFTAYGVTIEYTINQPY